jgi:alanyl-tRNA synthetase
MTIKTRQDLIKEYISFFTKKKHKQIPNASLVPANDPTVLFTTAGMHPLVPYLQGQKHPLGKRLVNVQQCIRTGDIEDVGDKTHHTFFEMLGNWSLGDYWKPDALAYTLEFITKSLKIPIEKLAITCFNGNSNAPKDTESEKIWISLGFPKERIQFLPKEDNFWDAPGESGPCGPDTEIFFWNSREKTPKIFDPKNKSWIEIGNNVLMQFTKKNKEYIPAVQKNIDFGGGVERTLTILENKDDNYLSSTFLPIIKQIEKISHKSYEDNKYKKPMRIIADHIKASVFILNSSVIPSNTEHGYILRRLIRRAIRFGKLLNIEINFTKQVAETVFPIYPDYKDLQKNKLVILQELEKEENKFKQTVERGIRLFNKISYSTSTISGKDAFLLFQSYGFPIEMTEEMAKEKKIKVDVKGYHQAFKTHQKLSRSESSGRFKSGLADHSEITTRLHTATHLLNEALTRVLGEKAAQRGSNITQERTRFDFTFDRKLTDEEIKAIEDLMNKTISKNLSVVSEELPLKKAFSSGAKGEFGHKYPDKVTVFTVLDSKEKTGFFSREICTGPHVTNTSKIGHFKIIKQQSVSAGVRRIKAIVS